MSSDSGAPALPPGTSTIKRALAAIDRLQARVDAAEQARTEPIAIVGLACRFPGGVDSPDSYWTLLAGGVDAITEVPRERWDIERFYDPDPDAAGKMYTRHGGFLRNVDRFDSWFFRVSPREARSMDPQQRLLLEVAWEALEDAGAGADQLRGSATGVFVGLTTNDYAPLLMKESGGVDAFFFSGNPPNAAAGRLAYTFGFQGPALAIDTACSSSLVSVHQACASLRNGECARALAGGVNLVLTPDNTVAVCRTRALSPDGRCKTFDKDANGFVRSEGCGLVVLKRLSEAIADGDRIRAVIRGSAINQDGASSGFTVPNGTAQQAVIRQALGSMAPADIDYLEAHGTGTALGDPIEVTAAAAVLGRDRDPARPLYIGSVKTNIGHCEAAAGVAALIKTVLSLEHQEIPPHLHLRERNPLIPWETLAVRVPDKRTSWPRGTRPRRAGVSAFGASGTNAHVVLEEAPAVAVRTEAADRSRHVLPLSARTPDALRDLVVRYRDRLTASPDLDFADVCYSAAAGRAHHRERTAIVAASTREAADKLDALAASLTASAGAVVADEPTRAPRIAFLFTGQGSQYRGMGRTLYATHPAFRDAIDRCAAILGPALDVPLTDLLFADQRLDDTRYTQPALFALEYALATMIGGWGIRPSVVMGHSLGEIVAAVIAGVFTLEDGLRLVAARAQLMGSLPAGGAMAAIAGDADRVRAAVEPLAPAVSIAAVNAPRSVVVSGTAAAVADVCERVGRDGMRAAPLTVSHAFHSSLMDPMLDAFERAAAATVASAPSIALISNVTGRPMDAAPDAAYWRRHCRDTVRFADGVDALVEAGCDTLIEIGPRPTLIRLAAQCRGDAKFLGLATLAPGDDDWDGLLQMVAALYLRGVAIDWRAFDAPYARQHVTLPTYPFRRDSHWISKRDDSMQKNEGRRDAVLGTLRAHIALLLQAPESEINIHLPFLEMGADSLVMVDAIGLVEEKFGVKLAIRRFFEDLSTIDALAEFIDAAMPETAAAAPSAPALVAESSATAMQMPSMPAAMASSGAGSLERILGEQNRLMAQFLAQQADVIRLALGGHALPAAAMAKPAAPTAAPVAAPRPVAAIAPAAADGGRVAPAMPWGNPAEIRKRGLSDGQSQHLESLITRYTARTPKSKERTQQYRAVLADSRATVGFRLSTKEMLYPIWGARSNGSRVWDVDDNEYIDYTMGFGVHLFGHKPGFVQQAVQEEFDHAVELGARSPLVGEVAQLFTELTGLDRVALSNSGTEAVMAAVRLARARTGRDKIVIFTNGYHGHADTTLARAQTTNGVLSTVPMAPGVPAGIAGDIVVLDYDSEESLDIIRRRGHEFAAVMVEPVQSRHLKVQPRTFLQELRVITREVGAALIFDEMITGFRADLGGAQAYFGVKADLATYGKIVGGGLPIGLVAGSAEFMDGVDGGMWQYGDGSFPAADRTAFGGTFCQHPLSMAAAAAVLRHLKAEGPGLQQRLNDRTDRLVRALNTHFAAEQFPIEATNFSSLFRFEFSSNLDLLFYHMLERGIYIWEWRSCFLSTAHSDEDIQQFVGVVQESLDDLRRAGFAPKPAAARGGAPEKAPLSDAQKQLLLLTQIESTSSIAYNVSTTVELRGRLDEERLRSALQRIVDRHSALRSTIAPDGAHQYIHDGVRVSLPVTDLSTQPAADRERALDRWREDVSRQPIDLVRGPVFQPRLVRLDQDRHVLMLTAHHILADGMTMGLVLKELSAFYNEPSAAAAPPMQFRDYVALCDSARGSKEMQAHEAYWLDTFADGVPQLDLPLDRPRPAAKTYSGGRVSQRLDPQTMSAVRKIARENGSTINMTLLTAFELLLHRYAGQDDLVVGTSVTGRPFPGSMDMAGYCTHLVPVRSRLDADPTFKELLGTTKRRLLDVLDHQDLPFAELLHKLPAARTAGAFPLISAVFNLEPVSALPEFRGLTPHLLPQAVSFTPFDLFVNVTDGGDTVLVDTDFNADLFDEATVRRLMGSYETLLGAIAADPSAKARTLPLLSAEERRRIVVEWNDTATSYPAAGVHQLIEQTAARQPDAIAVTFEGRDVTYASLNGRANQLAHWLRSHGAGPDVLVGICAERSVDLVVSILAVLKSGSAYVPIDPEYPADRVAFMLKDAGAPIVLTQEKWSGLLASYQGERFRLDADAAQLAKLPAKNLDLDVVPAQPAYMIYTSGSTGQPKGALNSHRGLTNRILWMQDAYGLRPDDRVLQKTPFSFDVSVWEFIWPLVAGARLVVAKPGGHRDARYLADLIAKAGITTLHFVPSMLQAFLEEPRVSRCTSIRRVICSGEALSIELLRRYAAVLPAPLHNLYGPTEAAIDVTAWTCDMAKVRGSVPIGKPIANTQIYLLDPAGQPVPVGVTGELFIGGVGVGLGYRNRPELTTQAFVPDPFSGDKTARLYRTGDLARFRDDGEIEYLGRVDHQVKIRGFRIELGEIEAALMACPGVASAVVVCDEIPSKRLVGYVVAANGAQANPASLAEQLTQRLPAYMVPSAFVALEAIPRLPNGKLDRSRLPGVAASGPHVAPAAGVESAIAAIWEEVLRQTPIGAADDFFALGGNSLSAGQVVSRLARDLDARVGIKDIFTYPTIRSLAAEIRRANGQDLPAIERLAVQPSYELSQAQRRFWIQDRLGDESRGNSHPASFVIEGALDRGALRRAFDALVARHEILRTVFVEIDGQPRQRVLEAGDGRIEFEESRLADGADLDQALRQIEQRQASRRMNLATGPLLRVHVAAAGTGRHLCVCSMHHTITDGWSVGVLLNDLAAIYDALVAGQPDPLPPLAIQYKDYAAWQNRLLDGAGSEAMRAYWRGKLGNGVPSLSLPADFPRTGARYERATARFAVDRPLVEQLAATTRQQGATLFMGMLAAIKVLLYRHTAQEDFCVGTPVAGRVHADLENQIGVYLNVLPLRDTLRGDDTLAAVLHTVRETTLDAYAHQLYPFNRIVDDLRLKREPGRNPLFDVGFTLQNQNEVQRRDPSRHLSISELDREDEAFEDPEAETDLWFVARNDEGSLAVQVVYNGTLFQPERVDALSRDLLAIVTALAANPDSKLNAIALAAGDSRRSGRRITVDLGL